MVVAHQAIFPEKDAPIYDFISAESWANNFQSTWTAYGHIHSRMKVGAFYEIGGTVFCNNGAISRGSLHEETINRELAITIFDSCSPTPFTSIPIPYKPADVVFNLEAFEVLKSRDSGVTAFLDTLGSTELTYLTLEDIVEHSRTAINMPKKASLELEDIMQTITP